MHIKGNYIKREQVIYCKEADSMRTALDLLHLSGYTCLPVLDSTGEKYLGNIYQINILEQKEENYHYSIEKIINKECEAIGEDSSLLDIIRPLKKLSFIAVNDQNGNFLGILPRSKVIDLIGDPLLNKNNGSTLTIATHDHRGALADIFRIFSKLTDVKSIASIDSDSNYLRRIIVTLPEETTQDTIGEIIKQLEAKGVRVVEIKHN